MGIRYRPIAEWSHLQFNQSNCQKCPRQQVRYAEPPICNCKKKKISKQRNDEQLIDNHLNTVSCPADGVEKVTTYLSCRKCNTAFPLTSFNCWKKDSALRQLSMCTVKRQMYKTHNRQNTVHQRWRTNIPNHFRR